LPECQEQVRDSEVERKINRFDDKRINIVNVPTGCDHTHERSWQHPNSEDKPKRRFSANVSHCKIGYDGETERYHR